MASATKIAIDCTSNENIKIKKLGITLFKYLVKTNKEIPGLEENVKNALSSLRKIIVGIKLKRLHRKMIRALDKIKRELMERQYFSF